MTNTIATWSIHLNIECPGCHHEFNGLEIDEFLEDTQLAIGEHETSRSEDIDVQCPFCSKEFLIDCEY